MFAAPNGPATPEARMWALATSGGSPPDVPAFWLDTSTPANSRSGQLTIRGRVLSFRDSRLSDQDPFYRSTLWNAIRGNLLVPSDNRFAWVPMYRRDVTYVNTSPPSAPPSGELPIDDAQVRKVPSPFVILYMIPVTVRNRSTYDPADLTGAIVNLEPRLVSVAVAYKQVVGAYVLEIAPSQYDINAGTGAPSALDSVAEGAVIIISDDRITQPPEDRGLMNGRTFRVGVRRPDLDSTATLAGAQVWEMAPGSEFTPDPGANGRLAFRRNPPTPGDSDDIIEIGNTAAVSGGSRAVGPADALLVGRNITATAGQYEGPAQDVGVYVTFIRVN
jgi:hypothetical protein